MLDMGGKPHGRERRSGDVYLQPYLDRLADIPFVRRVRAGADQLWLDTLEESERFQFAYLRGPLGYAQIGSLISKLTECDRWILLTPHVSPGIGQRISEHGGNYADIEGNCHVTLGQRYYFHVEGKRPSSKPVGHRPMRGPGLKVLLALLVEPQLATAPVRVLAGRAGASKSTVSNLLRQLKADGRLMASRSAVKLSGDLWDTFAVGYAESLRPAWLRGRFRAREHDLAAVEKRFAGLLPDDLQWAWGGGAAADRLTRYYHGPQTVLHLATIPDDLPHQLRLLRAADGPIHLIRTPCPVAFAGPAPHVVVPVLAYAELLCDGDDRAIETARLIREQYQAAE